MSGIGCIIVSNQTKGRKQMNNINGIYLIIFSVLISIILVEILIFSSFISNEIKKKKNIKQPVNYCYDNRPNRFFITGDKHRNFDSVKQFCSDMRTTRNDVLIVLGDAGFNYYDDKRDDALKDEISLLNLTLFCLQGNKECRPENVGTYGIKNFCGGKVYYEPKYPKILFAIDGEIYDFEGKKYMVVGGAHSVDKNKCLQKNLPYWFDEMPSEETKRKVEERLSEENNKIYGMLTHTCPIDCMPTEVFLSTRQNALLRRDPDNAEAVKPFKADIDRSTEIWLGELKDKLEFEVWFCGHYHVDKELDNIFMLYNEIRPLHWQEIENDLWLP